MKLLSYILIALLLPCTLPCNSLAQAKPFKATAGQIAALMKQADEMASALQQQNIKKLTYYTYPKLMKALGGEDKMAETLTASMAQMQVQGISIKSITVGDIKTVVKSAADLYALVPTVVQLSANGTVITKGSTLLGVSRNNGLRWYFVNANLLKGQNMKKLLPTYPDGLVIPQAGM